MGFFLFLFLNMLHSDVIWGSHYPLEEFFLKLKLVALRRLLLTLEFRKASRWLIEVILYWVYGWFHDGVTACDCSFTSPKGIREVRTKRNPAAEHMAVQTTSEKHFAQECISTISSAFWQWCQPLLLSLLLPLLTLPVMMMTTREEHTWEGRTGKRIVGFSSKELLSKIRTCWYVCGKLCKPYHPENLTWHLEMASVMPLSIPSAVQQDVPFYYSIQKTKGGGKDVVAGSCLCHHIYKSVFARLLK